MRKIFLLMMVCTLIFMFIGCSSEATINQNDSLETKVEKTALKVAAKKENIIETNFIDDIINNGKIVELKLNTKNSGRLTLLGNSKDLFEGLFQIEGISEVQLIWNADLVDQYGKAENMPVLKIILKKDTANKIGWDLFDENKFENIADSFWMHKAYEK